MLFLSDAVQVSASVYKSKCKHFDLRGETYEAIHSIYLSNASIAKYVWTKRRQIGLDYIRISEVR